jgi:hypothetical protein
MDGLFDRAGMIAIPGGKSDRRAHMKNFIACRNSLAVIACLCSALATAQEKPQDRAADSAKIDSILMLQKKMYGETKNEPLAGRKFGVELNIFRLLLMDKALSLSGSFSLFGANRHAEVAFPVYYSNPDDPMDLNDLTVDCHYRYFLGNTQNGMYLSGFARFAHLDGYPGDNDPFDSDGSAAGGRILEDKIGAGVGIGYRRFSYKGLYWGASLNLGRYFIGKNDRFYGSLLSYDDDNEIIVDIEFLKFGWAF